MRFALARLELRLTDEGERTTLLAANYHEWLVTEDDDLDALVAYVDQRVCSYQVQRNRDLFCTCCPSSEAALIINERPAAPTSRPICGRCDLPNTDSLCSHFLHPVVQGFRADEVGLMQRQLVSSLCDQGHTQEISIDPGACRPGGHPCWQRVVEVVPSGLTSGLTTSLNLPEALDFLDALWRNGHGGAHLLGQVAMTHVAALGLPCNDREEFKSRTNDLYDVLDAFQVPPVPTSGPTPAPQRSGTLNRLEDYLTYCASADPASVARIQNAVGTLRAVATVRNAVHHSDAGRKLPTALAALGIPFPPVTWATVWEMVRLATNNALVALRDEVRRLWP